MIKQTSKIEKKITIVSYKVIKIFDNQSLKRFITGFRKALSSVTKKLQKNQ